MALKSILFLLLLSTVSDHSQAQIWKYPYSPLPYYDNMNDDIESVRGRKSQTIYEITGTDTLVYRYEYDKLGRVILSNTEGYNNYYSYKKTGYWVKWYSDLDSIGTSRRIKCQKGLITSLDSKYSNGKTSKLHIDYDKENRVIRKFYDDTLIDSITYSPNRMTVYNVSDSKLRAYDRADFHIYKDSVYYECFFLKGPVASLVPYEKTYGLFHGENLVLIHTDEDYGASNKYTFDYMFKTNDTGYITEGYDIVYLNGELVRNIKTDEFFYDEKGKLSKHVLYNSEGLFATLIYVNEYY